ncbi:hypothetical protein EN742_17600 [Mesorhizobium sp. M4A.F.Ca.ET.020.02.1.1]|uniref:hypothetical protein n=1 Tax=unclassified Mesorhizobium TaxID=325217 RepID=UPI000FD3B7FD|nr:MULTISPECIES: hypothetical protein [unclassified Mesorhizobium]RVD38514.1 hypothetical protein EN742_17600 [Mesorhizobium sp. M4A.F.Ca.ET.020.02.1.1]RWC17086.1 MAG: hypothetical protein EOS53_19195 [Mesorhizobium sp.]
MKIQLALATAAVAFLDSTATFAAGTQDYLPPGKAAAILADGAPRSASAPNGRSFKLTLNKSGTGSIRGPLLFSLSVNWALKGDAMCITYTMISECLRFREVPGGLQGWNGDKPDLKMTR